MRAHTHTRTRTHTHTHTHTQKKGLLFGRKRREYPVEYEGQTFPFGKLILIAEIKNFCGVASFRSGLSDTRPAKFSDSARTRFHLYSFFGNSFTLDHNKWLFIVELPLTEIFAGLYVRVTVHR